MKKTTVGMFLTMGLVIGTACMASASPLELLVPAYFYPGGNTYWSDLVTAAQSGVSITAILNPASGPGTVADPNYVNAVNALRAAGGKVVGYVPTTFGARSAAAVKADIATYTNLYSVDGIFLDEMDNSTSSTVLDYYADLYTTIKTAHPGYRVIGNPGTSTDPAYLTRPTADTLVTFEQSGSVFSGYTPSAWQSGFSPSHFGNIIHTESSASQMLSDIQKTKQQGVGLVYVTDDTLSNPYDTLPSYWNQEVAAVKAASAAPEPGTLLLLACGGIGILPLRRRRKQIAG